MYVCVYINTCVEMAAERESENWTRGFLWTFLISRFFSQSVSKWSRFIRYQGTNDVVRRASNCEAWIISLVLSVLHSAEQMKWTWDDTHTQLSGRITQNNFNVSVNLENLNCKFKFRSANVSFVQIHSTLFLMNSLQASFYVTVCILQ